MSVSSTFVPGMINIIWRKYAHRYTPYICTERSSRRAQSGLDQNESRHGNSKENGGEKRRRINTFGYYGMVRKIDMLTDSYLNYLDGLMISNNKVYLI